jgi:hypothetical protein
LHEWQKPIEREYLGWRIREPKRSKDDLTPCSACNCMTKSIRLGRCHLVCGKCKKDKTLSDVYFYEATKK